MKFQITLTVEFEAEPEWYGEDKSPQEMLDIDIKNYDEEPWNLAELCQTHSYKVSGKVLEE